MSITAENKSNELKEFTSLAAKVIGVKECGMITSIGQNNIVLIQIYIVKGNEFVYAERIELLAFNLFFRNNFGNKKNDELSCFFETPYEAFYALIKAWNIWKNSLDKEIKESFISFERNRPYSISNSGITLHDINYLNEAVD